MNWGIIGYGNIAQTFEKTIEELDGQKICAIKTQKKLKKNFYLYRDYNEFFLSNLFDAVYVSNRNNLHLESALECIKFKKKFIIEKPFLNSIEDFLIFEKKLNLNPVLFYEGYMNLYYSIINNIFNYAKNNLGELKHISCSTGFSIKKKKFGFKYYSLNKNHRIRSKIFYGGAINDIGCYCVAFVTKLISFLEYDLEKFSIDKKNVLIGTTSVDEQANCEINYNNININLNCSIIKDVEDKIFIIGSKGKIIIFNPWLLSDKTKVIYEDSHGTTLKEEYPTVVPRHKDLILNFCKDSALPEEQISQIIKKNLQILKINTSIIEQWRNK